MALLYTAPGRQSWLRPQLATSHSSGERTPVPKRECTTQRMLQPQSSMTTVPQALIGIASKLWRYSSCVTHQVVAWLAVSWPAARLTRHSTAKAHGSSRVSPGNSSFRMASCSWSVGEVSVTVDSKPPSTSLTPCELPYAPADPPPAHAITCIRNNCGQQADNV